MVRNRKDDLAKLIIQKRKSGMTYRAIGKEVGLSNQRVQQIFKSQKINSEKKENGFYCLSIATRRAILSELHKRSINLEVSAGLVGNTFFEGDLKLLNDGVYDEVVVWLEENGYSVKDGFTDYNAFNGSWRAAERHLADGRLGPWLKYRIYKVAVISRDRARLEHKGRIIEIRLVDLQFAFHQIDV